MIQGNSFRFSVMLKDILVCRPNKPGDQTTSKPQPAQFRAAQLNPPPKKTPLSKDKMAKGKVKNIAI